MLFICMTEWSRRRLLTQHNHYAKILTASFAEIHFEEVICHSPTCLRHVADCRTVSPFHFPLTRSISKETKDVHVGALVQAVRFL
jgi:hypothetical protein